MTCKLFAQTPYYFNNNYHFQNNDSLQRIDWFRPVLENFDGTFRAVGQTWNFNTGNSKLLIKEISVDGIEINTEIFGDSNDYYLPQSIFLLDTSSYIIASAKATYLDDSTWFHLLKLNQNNNIIFEHKYSSGKLKNSLNRGIKTTDSGYVFIGQISHGSPDSTFIYLLKVDSLGNEQWSKSFFHYYHNNGLDVIQNPDNGFTIAGYTNAQFGQNRDVFIIRTDSLGNENWRKNYSTPFFEFATSVSSKQDGWHWIICGQQCIGPNVTDNGEGFLLEIDSSSTILWNKLYSNLDNEWFECVSVNQSDEIVAVGTTRTYVPSKHFGWYIKTDPNGYISFNRKYAYDSTLISFQNYFWGLSPTTDGGYLFGGTTNPGSTGNQDAWLVKVDSLGCELSGCWSVGLEDNPSVASDQKENITIFPNPISLVSIIEFNNFKANIIPEQLILYVFDITGKKLETRNIILQKNMNNFSLPFHRRNLKSGIYFVEIVSAEGMCFGKMRIVVQ